MLLLLIAGLAGGFVAGLLGVGGGIVFAPVLFVFFQQRGVDPAVIAPLTIGTSLLCTLIAAGASAWRQQQRGAVDGRLALGVGASSAVAVVLATRFVTTQPWYDGTAFQVVFAAVLTGVALRMVRRRRAGPEPSDASPNRPWWGLALTGSAAGLVSSLAGVGGGIVLVPAYHQGFRLPLARAVGTSSATIVGIAGVGVVLYGLLGIGATEAAAGIEAGTLGYVAPAPALLLAVPAAASAALGVWTAHRIDTRLLRLSFAALALLVAARLLWGALGG